MYINDLKIFTSTLDTVDVSKSINSHIIFHISNCNERHIFNFDRIQNKTFAKYYKRRIHRCEYVTEDQSKI